MHGVNFQSVVAPNLLIASLFGPVEGRRHDSGMLVDSGLLQELSHYSFAPDGTPLQLSLSIKYFEVFWNSSTPNPGLFQLGF